RLHASRRREPVAPGEAGAMTTERRVLVVDDDPVVRRVLCSMLRTAGYDAVPAADGQEAWDTLSQDAFDIVVTDRSMPGMGGIALLRAIRQSPAHATLPVVMLTGSLDADVAPE